MSFWIFMLPSVWMLVFFLAVQHGRDKFQQKFKPCNSPVGLPAAGKEKEV